MKCTHYACVGTSARLLPATDSAAYDTGHIVTAGGRHYLLGQAHWQHYGAGDASLDVRWVAKELPVVDPDLTRERD